MSSSTMIHGATMRRASAMRNRIDSTTIVASQTHGGSAAARARSDELT